MNFKVLMVVLVIISYLNVSCGMNDNVILYFKDGRELTGFGKFHQIMW